MLPTLLKVFGLPSQTCKFEYNRFVQELTKESTSRFFVLNSWFEYLNPKGCELIQTKFRELLYLARKSTYR